MAHKSQETTFANSDFSRTMCLTCTAPHLNQELKPARNGIFSAKQFSVVHIFPGGGIKDKELQYFAFF